MSDWKPGDRVRITPTGRDRDWVTATVIEISDHPRGVHVRLDRLIRGADVAFAHPDELEPCDG